MNLDLPKLSGQIVLLILFGAIVVFSPVKVFAEFGFVKNVQPILTSANPPHWDTVHIATSFTYENNNLDQVWYAANGGTGWKLGFAQFDVTQNTWSRNLSPLEFQGQSDLPETNASDPFLIIDKPNNTYKIWYNAINSGQYSIRYATSTDGQVWTKYPTAVLQGTSGTWDGSGLARGKSVIYRNDLIPPIYQMWYSGGTSPNWKIGYATSEDGITWHKQNNGQPVLTPTETWEEINVNYPDVFYHNGVYHMFYGTGASDMSDKILYAYSFDGINWVKPKDMNPVLIPELSWEMQNIASPYVLINDNQLKMWYSGLNNNKWQIGYATASLSSLPTPAAPTSTPTPTPTPTPTATPTPTNTPTPTPSPAPTRKVIIIPGMTASWNLDAMINCKKDNYAGSWSLLGPAKDIYNPLVQSLTKAGWQVSIFPYDWRMQMPSQASNVSAFVHNLTKNDEKIDIVGHSMGGLVAQAYLESEQENSKIEKLMTVGSPHQGVPLIYPAWSAGQVDNGNPTYRFMLTLLEKRCAFKTHNDRLAIQEYFPSLQNLLPTFDYLTDNATDNVKPVASMHARNNWLPISFAWPFFGTIVGTLSGTGQTTTLGYRVTNPSPADAAQGNWVDGKPIQPITTTEGDGTVPTSSELLDGAINFTIPETHTGLISSQMGISQIQQFLTNTNELSRADLLKTQKKPTKPQAPIISSSLYIIADPANFWLLDHHGKIIKPTSGIIALSNPKSENYTLVILPKSKETLLIIAQDLGDKFFYKEYTLKNPFPKIKLIRFDAKHPKENILK